MMRKLLVLSIGLAVSTVIAYGGGEGDASLGRVKANFVRVLRDANALVYSEIAKMGGVPPVADSSIRTLAESGGVSPAALLSPCGAQDDSASAAHSTAASQTAPNPFIGLTVSRPLSRYRITMCYVL